MISLAKKRKLSVFFRWSEPLVDLAFLLMVSIFFLNLLPPEVFGVNPATGGDTGSHFWPLYVLVNYGIPEGVIKTWNPGNLAGEPHFVHYFPFPFLLMALLNAILPLGQAFNIGTLLPLFFLPISVYASCRLMGLRFPAPLFATAFTIPFIYNESFSMWGGNTLSTLAGQFAHVYALCFFLLGLGFIAQETRRDRFPLVSGLLFAGVALSHAYVLLGVPFAVLGYVLFGRESSRSSRFLISLKSALVALSFSVWFLVPMLDNAKWNTSFYFVWHSENIWAEVAPRVFYPALLALVLALLVHVAFILRKKKSYLGSWLLFFWMVPNLAYLAMYWIFPKVGLVDVRVVPQIQLYVSLMAACLLGLQLRASSRFMAWLFSVPVALAVFYWGTNDIKNFTPWCKWNYSSWEVKPAYKHLSKLYTEVAGSFSQPRIVFEHNDINNQAGTTRVFEMLPYFARRSTLESVYLQASVMSAAAFHMQALVSKTPSCPFSQYKCPKRISNDHSVKVLAEKMELAGVESLILVTEESRKPVAASQLFEDERSFGNWHYRKLLTPVSLVQTFMETPDVYRGNDWKQVFYSWFESFRVGKRFLISAEQMSSESEKEFLAKPEAWSGFNNCDASVEVDFNRLELTTSCPEKAHLLKFAYHSSWQADSGSNIYNVSPGYMALVPKQSQVTLRFGQSLLWQLSVYISFLGMALSVLWFIADRRKWKI